MMIRQPQQQQQQQLYHFLLVLLSISIIATTNSNNNNVVIVVDAYDWTCNLFCHNKGVCRHGSGKFGAYGGIGFGVGDGSDSQEVEDLTFENELHDNGMYCTCPAGFTGLQCEIKYVTCGRDDHTCHNGSACVKERSSDTGEVFYRCECDTEGSVMDAPYAQKYCEHIATVFCEMGDGFQYGTSYCTNGGKCKPRVANSGTINKHDGCDCPHGLEGEYCETRIENIGTATEELVHEIEEYLTVGEIIGIVIGVFIGLALLLFYARRNWCGSKRGTGSDQRGGGRGRGRRGRNKSQERIAYADDTRDII